MSDVPIPTLPADVPVNSGRRTSALTRRLAQLTFHTNFDEERFFLLLSIFIGIFSGLAVVCFRVAIDWSRIILMGALPRSTALRLIGAPTAVGLLVAILVIHLFHGGDRGPRHLPRSLQPQHQRRLPGLRLEPRPRHSLRSPGWL